MPSASQATINNLITARDNLAQCVANTTADWVKAGAPPTYSIDGESYEWNSWLTAKMEEIDRLTTLINRLSGPWIIRSRGRS